MDYEPVIGLETHVQLLTRSKMFCGCSAAYAGAEPNTHVCPICLAMPGVLPVINQQAVEYTLLTALALNCEIPEASKFDRKNYPYPDLLKGYQISQYDLPFSVRGWITIDVDAESQAGLAPGGEIPTDLPPSAAGPARRRVGITRAHLEEDTAKLIHRQEQLGRADSHEGTHGSSSPSGSRPSLAYSLIDANRSGVPLMEIVSEPDMRSPAEARAYLQKLRLIVQTLGVSSGNMEEGAMRCDVNVSLRPVGSDQLGTKVEIKNLNSARSVQRALEYEIERQRRVLEAGGRLVQETRGWDEDRGVTVSQRSKEEAHDYRYFPEPDLPPIFLDPEWVEELRRRLPELPDARRDRYVQQYQLSRYDAVQLTSSPGIAAFFEQTVALYPQPKAVANWIQGELFRILRERDLDLAQIPLTPERMAELLMLVEESTVSQNTAKEVFEEVALSGRSARAIVGERGLLQISDTPEIERLVAEALAANPAAVADFRAGKKQALGFLTGQVMRATRGKANPALVNQILERQLG